MSPLFSLSRSVRFFELLLESLFWCLMLFLRPARPDICFFSLDFFIGDLPSELLLLLLLIWPTELQLLNLPLLLVLFFLYKRLKMKEMILTERTSLSDSLSALILFKRPALNTNIIPLFMRIFPSAVSGIILFVF